MDVSGLKVTELRKELRSRGHSVQGDKAELAQRLRRALSEEALDQELGLAPAGPEPAEPEPEPGPEPEPEPESAPAPPPGKKIVLNRTVSAAPAAPEPARPEPPPPRPRSPARPQLDARARLEMRAKRFGLPPTKEALKEARRERFSQPAASVTSQTITASVAELDVLKKRAERFGTSVSKVMSDIENKERLERRKQKFGAVKA